MNRRTLQFDFFSRYWNEQEGLHNRYTYHWFTRKCRTDLFRFLEHCPSGPCVEIGSGRGSTMADEPTPTDIHLDILPWILPGRTGLVADAQRLPFRDRSLSALWGQTVCMHLSWRHLFEECFRCVKTGGGIGFLEPLHGNPLIGLFRRFDTSRRSRPRYLSFKILRTLGEQFGEPSLKSYYLFSPITVLFTRRQHAVVSTLQSVDAYLLERIPRLRPYAWYASICWNV